MTDKRANNCDRSIFTLDEAITYQIKLAGELSENLSAWMEMIDIQLELDPSGFVTTILLGSFDQAALLGLLRRLYHLGYPLISVNCVQSKEEF